MIKLDNVCPQYITDEDPCSFNEIIHVFLNSRIQPNKVVLKIPLVFIQCLTQGAGLLFPRRADWINSFYNKLANSLVFYNKLANSLVFYNKLANSLVFDNKRLLDTGFCPKQSLSSVFGKV